jgi:energy-coupling factor transporter ATP-binding protein EcfA2
MADAFEGFVGEDHAIRDLDSKFPTARVTIVVGTPGSGKSEFVRRARVRFADTHSFFDVRSERAVDLTRDVRNVLSRGVDVLAACGGGASMAGPRVAVVDDFDALVACDRTIVKAVQTLVTDSKACFVLIVDRDGERKLGPLKKGNLVIHLRGKHAPGRDGWAGCSTVAAAARLFCREHAVSEIMQAASCDGGSMVGAVMWHNAPRLGVRGTEYTDRALRMLDALVLERAGHVGNDKELNSVGTMLSIAPWCGTAPGRTEADLEYTRSIADLGTRQKARNAISASATIAGVTLAEAVALQADR